MTEIHRGDCACDRCITELADAILGKPPTLAAIRRAKPWIMPAEPMIADFSDEPTLIEEVPVDIQQRLDAVNARLAGLDKEEEQRAIERAKKALDRLEEKTAGEFRLLGVDEMVGADGTTAAVDRALAALDTDYAALGYPETAIGTCDLESDCELAISAVRAAISCIEGSVVLRPWEPPSEKASL